MARNSKKLTDNKAQNFRLVATDRTNRALKAMKTLSLCGNPKKFESNPEQIKAIIAALRAQIDQTERALSSPSASNDTFKL